VGLFLLVFAWKTYQYNRQDSVTNERGQRKNWVNKTTDDAVPELNRYIRTIIYTKHARCRMDCRHIDETKIKEILQQGTINYRKSGPSKRGGYEFALEGASRDNQYLRVIFAQEDDKLIVITCIDLDKEWACDCPCDEYKN
jgi:hypothetical protein